MSIHMSPSTIDIILTNNIIGISQIKTRNIFSSDHVPVVFEAALVINYEKERRFNYKKANWPKFRDIINLNITDVIASPIINEIDVDNQIHQLQKIVKKRSRNSHSQRRFG